MAYSRPTTPALSDILPFVFVVRSRAIELSNVPRNLNDSRRFMKASCYGCYAEFSIIISIVLITVAFQLHFLYIFINSLPFVMSVFNLRLLFSANSIAFRIFWTYYENPIYVFVQHINASRISFLRERIIREILRGSCYDRDCDIFQLHES